MLDKMLDKMLENLYYVMLVVVCLCNGYTLCNTKSRSSKATGIIVILMMVMTIVIHWKNKGAYCDGQRN